MDSADPALRREVEAFDPAIPVERAWMPPSSWYVSDALYGLERSGVFYRTWQPVARVAQLSDPGSYLAGRTAGEPWVVTKDAAGKLRAFVNACRHKGREVVTGSGQAESLICGYHAWRYGLDGALQKAPQIAGIEDFDRHCMGLPELRVDIWGPWIFITADQDALPLAEMHAEVHGRLEESGWGNLTYVGSREWTLECNWKVYVDNYLDGGYHVPHMHPSLTDQLTMGTYATETFAASSIQTSGAAEGVARIGEGAIYAWMFPNFMLNRYGTCLDSNLVLPLGPHRCRVLYDFFFADPEAKEDIEASMAQSDVTQKEDIEICESVQIGLASTGYDRGRYAPQVERGEHHFHQLLAEAYRAQLE